MFTPITTARRKEGGRPREILSPPTKRSQDTNDYRIPAVWTRKPGIDHLERNVIILNGEWRGECLRFQMAVNGFFFSSPSPPLLFFFSFQGHVSGRLPARHLLFLRFEISRHDSSHCYRLSGDKRGDLDPESRERIRTYGVDESRRFHTSNISR